MIKNIVNIDIKKLHTYFLIIKIEKQDFLFQYNKLCTF